ncbi:MAG TPA: hypothetical protein VF992_07670 [Thermoplasmata archaeon]
MRRMELTASVVLVIAGIYFLLFHRDPLPLNHESVGLGNLHFVHDIIGIGLIGIAGLLWWRSRPRVSAPSMN